MPESTVQVTTGAGPKLHTWQYTIGANPVEDGFQVAGEYPYPAYTIVAQNVSVATSGDHVLALNAGSSNRVRIRRITIEQSAPATAAGTVRLTIRRTTTAAPTGGTALTPAPHDTGDAASGASARTLPTAKGTESTILGTAYLTLRQAVSATGSPADDAPYVWQQLPNSKPLVIPAGTTNGLAIVVGTGAAGATVDVTVELVETSY